MRCRASVYAFFIFSLFSQSAASGVSECVRRVACGIRRRLLHGAQHTNVHAAHQPVLYFTRVTCYCVCVCIARGDAV